MTEVPRRPRRYCSCRWIRVEGSISLVSSSRPGTIGIVPTTATPVRCSTSSAARMRRSDTVRIIANAMPKPRPRMPPTITAVCTSGKLGEEGSDATSPGRIVTGAEPGLPSPSMSSISTFIASIHASASARADSGDGPCASTLMNVVSGGFDTSIRFTSCSGVVLSPSSSIACSATVRQAAISRYVGTLDRASESPSVDVPRSSTPVDER